MTTALRRSVHRRPSRKATPRPSKPLPVIDDTAFPIVNAECPRCGGPVHFSDMAGVHCPRPGCSVRVAPAKQTAVEVDELVERYLPLARKIARQFAAASPWLREELESEAAYALWKAARYFKPGRAKFPTFAHLVIRRDLRACLRRGYRHAGRHSSQEIDLGTFAGPEADSQNLAAADVAALLEIVNLPAVTVQILRERFAGVSLRELAAKHGDVCENSISARLQRALGRLRDAAARREAWRGYEG